MAVNQATEDYLLPCARRLEDIWERVDAGVPPVDEHERTCPHCTTARESLVLLHSATRQLADEPLTPPAGLTGRIMAAVRADIRRATMIPLPAPRGGVQISEQAIAVVLRFATDRVPGVRARRCTVRQLPGAPPGVVAVDMSLALQYGTGPAAQVMAAVRAAVLAAADEAIGVRIADCTLTVEDVFL